MKAVIDRIEDDLAVILLGEKGEFQFNILFRFFQKAAKRGIS